MAANGGLLGKGSAMVLLQVKDYRLTTAEILYHMPDHPGLLQAYIWQNMDLAPSYPELRRFLVFWDRNLDGKVHSIRVACGQSVRPASVRHATHLQQLN
jgi:uncharacterized protein Usg